MTAEDQIAATIRDLTLGRITASQARIANRALRERIGDFRYERARIAVLARASHGV